MLVKKIIDRIFNVVDVLITIFITMMMIILIWQVFTRFIIKVPAIWTEELARYAFIYMAFLGAAFGVKNNEHFGMTLLVEKLSGKVRNFYMKYVVNIAILISAIILFKFGLDFSIEYGFTRVSPTFLVPMFWVFICVPISAFLMIISVVYNIFFTDYSKSDFLEEIEQDNINLGG